MRLNRSQRLRAYQEKHLREALKDILPTKGKDTRRRIEQLKDDLALRALETFNDPDQ